MMYTREMGSVTEWDITVNTTASWFVRMPNESYRVPNHLLVQATDFPLV